MRPEGARCEDCPLKACVPAVPKRGTNPNLIFVTGEPTYGDTSRGSILSDRRNHDFSNRAAQLGIPLGQVSATAARLCRSNKPLTRKQLKQANDCCRPRLLRELEPYRAVATFGNAAFQSVTGIANCNAWLGAPLPTSTGQVLPLPDWSTIFVKPSMIPVLYTWIARAMVLANQGHLAWSWPTVRHTLDGLHNLYKQVELSATEVVSIDIENNPETQEIRCIGFAVDGLAVSVPWEERYLFTIEQLLASPNPKVFHNAQHDVIELRAKGFTVAGDIHDTLLMHAVVAPQLPHDLGFCCAVELTCERWKSVFRIAGDDKRALTRFIKAPIDELLAYNAKDAAGTLALYDALLRRLGAVNRGYEQYEMFLKVDAIGQKMKTRGIQLAKDNLEGHKDAINEELFKLAVAFKELVPGDYTMGASGAHPSLGRLFFGKFQVPVVSRSEQTGEASLDSNSLTHYVGLYANSMPAVADVARTILRYRKLSKLLTSYVTNIPRTPGWTTHPTWRVFGARTGRWSATEPAIQTIPKSNKAAGTPGMRDIFCAREGYTLVECDYSQLELRIVALLSGDEKLLKWYAEGVDVHTLNAKSVFKTDSPSKQQRDLAKRVVYGLNYGGSAATIWKSLVVDFPGLKQEAVEYVVKRWFEDHPAISSWQKDAIAKAQRLGYVEESLSGKRQYYHDGKVKPTEVLNYPIQGAAGYLANKAIMDIDAAFDWDRMYLLMQVHDSTLSEIRIDHLAEGIAIVRRCMEQEVELGGAKIKFPVDVKVGTNWGKMEDYK